MSDVKEVSFVSRSIEKRITAAGGYIFHHPLPRMVPLLLRKEARGVCLSVLEKAKGMNAN